MKESKLASDQPHFYTMVTAIHASDLIAKYGTDALKKKLVQMARLSDGKTKAPAGKARQFKEYMELSSKQTTHPGRRTSRQALFEEILEEL